MVQVICKMDCGNAPKRGIVKDFCVALANRDLERALDMVSADISLKILGYASADGKAEVEQLLRKDMDRAVVTVLFLENILSHGKFCAANGILTFADQGKVAFCNMYTFDGHGKSAKLLELKAYSIALPQ